MTDLSALAKSLERLEATRQLERYLPYGHPDTLHGEWSKKPWQFEFHAAGASFRERMTICANRVGKTTAAGAEVAMHATGDYPDWWTGKRFDKAVLIWTGSPTTETSRDIVQKALIGGTGEDLGTGWIPANKIIGKPTTRQAGVSDVVDMIKVRHVSGGVSKIVLKTYDQGWRKWQGTEPHVVWLDEEPEDMRLYTEALTRVLTSGGILMVTFTPLLGETELTRKFMTDAPPSCWWIGASWDDAPHLSEKDKAEMMASYPSYERDARTKGVPMMGEGRVFKVSEDDIKVEPFEMPRHFARIGAIDFGIDHPFAYAGLAHDRDRDIVYLHDGFRVSGQPVPAHAHGINQRGKWIPIAWPHDGLQKGKSDGVPLYHHYRNHGCNLLSMSARYQNDKGGGQAVEPIVLEMEERMITGRFKVFSSLPDWFEEYRSLHRKDGKIVPIKDDFLKASMYALMMLRFARVEQIVQRKSAYRRPLVA